MWPSGDPRGQVNCGSSGVGVDGDVLHERPHQGDTPAAMGLGDRLRSLPGAAISNGELHLVAQYGRAQANDALWPVAVTVLDGVGDGCSGGDELVVDLV